MLVIQGLSLGIRSGLDGKDGGDHTLGCVENWEKSCATGVQLAVLMLETILKPIVLVALQVWPKFTLNASKNPCGGTLHGEFLSYSGRIFPQTQSFLSILNTP